MHNFSTFLVGVSIWKHFFQIQMPTKGERIGRCNEISRENDKKNV